MVVGDITTMNVCVTPGWAGTCFSFLFQLPASDLELNRQQEADLTSVDWFKFSITAEPKSLFFNKIMWHIINVLIIFFSCSRMREDMSTMVCVKEEEDPGEKLSQEEIISRTKQVIQGLEALKQEHHSILDGLLGTLRCLKQDEEGVLVEEKSHMIRKSMEMLELGLSEAQVRVYMFPDISNNRESLWTETFC